VSLTGSASRGAGLALALAGMALAQPPAAPPTTPRPAAAAPAPATPRPAAAPTPPAAPTAAAAPSATLPAIGAAPAAGLTPSGAPVQIPVQEAPARKAAPAKPAAPLTRARSNIAILQALDKVTAETIRFEAPVGQPVRYKTLVFTVRACETTAADEPVQDYSAYILIDSQALPTPGKAAPPARQAFRGWMYARSPGLNPLQHPVYDAWLISCRTSAPAAPAPKR
jgi:hypothetical protein